MLQHKRGGSGVTAESLSPRHSDPVIICALMRQTSAAIRSPITRSIDRSHEFAARPWHKRIADVFSH